VLYRPLHNSEVRQDLSGERSAALPTWLHFLILTYDAVSY